MQRSICAQLKHSDKNKRGKCSDKLKLQFVFILKSWSQEGNYMVIITFVFHLFSPNDLEVVQILLSRKKSQQ